MYPQSASSQRAAQYVETLENIENCLLAFNISNFPLNGVIFVLRFVSSQLFGGLLLYSCLP